MEPVNQSSAPTPTERLCLAIYLSFSTMVVHCSVEQALMSRTQALSLELLLPPAHHLALHSLWIPPVAVPEGAMWTFCDASLSSLSHPVHVPCLLGGRAGSPKTQGELPSLSRGLAATGPQR